MDSVKSHYLSPQVAIEKKMGKKIQISKKNKFLDRVNYTINWSFFINLDNNINCFHYSYFNREDGREVDNQENKNYLKEFLKKDSEDMEDTLQRYKNHLCGEYRKQLTITNYYNCIKRFLEHIHGNIDKENIQQWKIWANNHYRRIGSLNSNINAVNVFLKWYITDEDEYNRLKLKVMPRTETDEYSLNEEEYEKLFIQSRQNIETALIFELLSHLLRPREIINIKIQNRDKDILYLDDTKTGNNHIIMNQNLQDLWDRYLKIRPIPLEQYQEYLLIDNEPKWRGHRFKTTLPIRNRIYELGRQTGIEKKVKPYTIKRTCITLMLDKESKLYTGDPELVRMMARHKKLETTMKYNKKDEAYIRKYYKSKAYIQEKEEKISPIDKLYTLLIV